LLADQIHKECTLKSSKSAIAAGQLCRDKQIGQAVIESINDSSVVLLKNHVVFTIGLWANGYHESGLVLSCARHRR
jgi:hypothetical protein